MPNSPASCAWGGREKRPLRVRYLEPLQVSPPLPRARAWQSFLPIEGTSVTLEMEELAICLEMILVTPSPSAPASNPPASPHSATFKMYSFKIVQFFLYPLLPPHLTNITSSLNVHSTLMASTFAHYQYLPHNTLNQI